MNWLERRKERRRWSYVGQVEARCTLVDRDGKPVPGGKDRTFWVLSERGDGRRRAKRIGPRLHSAHATSQEADVEAWLVGGPLPDLCAGPGEPNKPAELIVFPGGKDGAACNGITGRAQMEEG